MNEKEHVVLWNRCLKYMKDNVSEMTFNTWFKPIIPLKCEGKTLTIGVPSPFFIEYLDDKFLNVLRSSFYMEIG